MIVFSTVFACITAVGATMFICTAKKERKKTESSLNGLLQQNVVRAVSQWTTCETLGGEKDWFCGMKYKWERKAYYCFCDKKKKKKTAI